MMKPQRLLPAILICVLAVLAFSAVPAWAREAVVHSFSTSFGESGGGNGQLALRERSGVAANAETGDVYIADTGNGRVDQFSSTGTFVRAFGGLTEPTFIAVDNSSGPSKGDVYVADAASGTVAKFMADGTPVTGWGVSGRLDGSTAAEGPFSAEEGAIAGIAVDHTGNLWVYDTTANRLYGFNEQGTALPTLHLERGTVPAGLAIDSVGNFYKINGEPGISKFGPEGGMEIGEVNNAFGGEGVTGLAFDSVIDDLYVDNGVGIIRFESSCQPEGGLHPCIPAERFGSPELAGGELERAGALAVGSGFTVYVADIGRQRIDVFTGKTIVLPDVATEAASSVKTASGTLNGVINPDETTITRCQFEYGTVESGEYALTAPCSPAKPAGSNPVPVTAAVSGLAPLTQYHFRLAASNSNGTSEGAEMTFGTSAPPTIISESVSALNSSEPKLEAKINPNYQATSYYFEYSTSETALLEGKGNVVPGAPPAADLPAVFEAEGLPTTPVGVTGLKPVTYSYRVVAENQTSKEAGTPVDGPIEHFTAFATPAAVTSPAGEPTRTTASVSGTVTPQGLPTAYHFAYIPQGAYEAAVAEHAPNPYAAGRNTHELHLATPEGTDIADYEAHAVQADLEELAPRTTYHYTLIAQNELGSAVGADQTFTTAEPTAPVATTGGAQGVSQLSATITGTVDTRGLQTTMQFEFGTAPGAGALIPATVTEASGTIDSVLLTFSDDLQPGTTYYYRVLASNQDGGSVGTEQSVTTPGLPAAFPTATLPGLTPYTTIAQIEAKEPKPSHREPPTRAQLFQKALRACHHKRGNKRASCEKQARKRYGPHKKKNG